MAKDIYPSNNTTCMMQRAALSGAGLIVVLGGEAARESAFVSMLEGAGYQVEVYDQPDAYKFVCCQSKVPAAIIMDRGIQNGGNVLAQTLSDMRSQCKHSVPVIFISERQDIAARLSAYRSGATHYLSKPVDLAGLLRLIGETAPLISAQHYRVMLVDSHSVHTELLAQLLRMSGMEVRVLDDPMRVLEALENFSADVLVLGMEMEKCTGPELAMVLHDDPVFTAIPVVYLSRESRLMLQIQSTNGDSGDNQAKMIAHSHLLDVIVNHARNYRRNVEKTENLRTARYELGRQQQALDAHAIVSATDVKGNIIYVNDKFCQTSGYSRVELLGKNHRIIKSGQHPPELYADMWHTISGGNIWQGEMCNRSKNGELYWVYTSIIPFLDAAGLPYQYYSIRTEITQVKKNEIALLQAKEAAEAGSRAKSEFLASMSHELRTPLNAILGFAQLFGMDKNLPQKTRDNAREIEQAGQHLLSLVNDLIDLARIESNKMELSLEAVAVKNVVSDSLNMVQAMARNKDVKVVLVKCDVQDISIWADFNRMRQALINLLTNAIKYNKPQGTVQMACEIIAGRVRIAVTDTGAGIAPDKQARIFNAFDRLGEEQGTVEGTGIGLVITKRIVEAMGGSIGFASEMGKGSTFWVELPLAASAGQMRVKTAKNSDNAAISDVQQTHVQANQPSVLYIEDNPMNMRLMQQIFSGRKEWELRSATNAESGIEMARANPPDLILLDINLTGMDGYQALELLKSCFETAHVPVVALSANAMKGDTERGLKAGFTDYLTKPLDIPKLLGLLEKLLKKRD